MDSQVLTIEKPFTELGQPKALYLLFFTELWERFGFYTLQAILILYMTKGLHMPDVSANLLYAAFSALLYLTPILGGFLADRYFGFQQSILIGGFLFIVAYLCCGSSEPFAFFIGLSLLICANGFFKPSVSSIVGDLYQQNDARREGGFTIFYMGINIGALIPPLITGALVVHYGWHAGFWLAAAGMIIGQVIFLFGRKQLGDAGAAIIVDRRKLITRYSLLVIGLIVCVALCQAAFLYPDITNYCVEASSILVVAFVLIMGLKAPRTERYKLFAALILIGISVGFWALYNQAFTSLMLFADRNMQKQLLGFTFYPEATQFFNPFLIITLSPVLSRLWMKLDNFGFNPTTQFKFVLGMFLMTLGFFLLFIASKYFSQSGLVSPWWIFASYLMQTLAELLISPIGLAMITVLCPKYLVGTMMGIWFFAQAISFAVGAYLANMAAIDLQMDALYSVQVYSHAFYTYAVIGLVMALISIFCLPLLNRMVSLRN